MAVYDDKTPGIIKSGNYSMIGNVKSRTEAVFKASYIVASDIQVDEKITALFDLIVIGDVSAHDIDVKGKFVCIGNCNVQNSLTVQDKLFVKEVRAKSIEVHDDITAQEIDVDVLKADGNIIVGQTLATEELAYSEQNILCGETAYGAGKISAHTIITGEELDMDDGEEAIVEPNKIVFDNTAYNKNPSDKKYAAKNDFESYIGELFENCNSDEMQEYTFVRWLRILKKVAAVKKQPTFECYDIGLLLGLTELRFSEYFCNWSTIVEWQSEFLDKFNKMSNGESINPVAKLNVNNLSIGLRLVHSNYGVGTVTDIKRQEYTMVKVQFENEKEISFQMEIALKFFSRADAETKEEIISKLYIQPEEFEEWASYLKILRVYGHMFSPKLVDRTMELLSSKLGIKSKFILDRIQENGWVENG